MAEAAYASGMKRALCLAVVVIAAACGETGSDGSSATGGTSSGGAQTGGSSSGGTPSGGTSSGGASGSGGGSTGGGAGSGGSAGADGSAGTGGADAGACQEGGVLDGGTEAIIAAACAVAVVKVTHIDEECSGAGGAHVTFDVIAVGKGPALTRVSYGGHAYYAPPDGPDKLGEYFVAGIDPFGKLVAQPDNPGWCITGLPSVDGRVHALVEAASEAAAKTKMAAILAK